MSRYNTPLRYPGGKQRLAAFIAEVIDVNELAGGHYLEPYAGGAGVAIELLVSGKVRRIHLNDSCPCLYAFWKSILDDTDEFCRRIASASLTVEEWRRQREIFRHPREHERLDVGFSLFYLNRCNRSGIPTGGLIGGLRQVGDWRIDARFNRNELIRRIEVIAAKRRAISVRNWDAEKFMLEYIPKLDGKGVVYCDPPYFHKADRLYRNHYTAKDHARIAKVIQRNLALPWIVSYDSAPEILDLYGKQKHFQYDLQYNASSAYQGTEVFVFSKTLKIPTASKVACVNTGLGALAA